MKKEKKNLPMKPMDQKDQEIINRISQRVGQLQAFAFISNISQVQVAHILKEMHDDGRYKQLGYRTWDEACAVFGIKRAISYQLMDNLKIAGPAMLEFLYKAGFSTYKQYLMLKGTGEIEDVEFEILSDDEIKIKDKKFSIKDNPEEAVECLFGLKHERDMERRARRDAERELKETKKDLENKKKKIQVGERKLAGWEYTKFDRALSEFSKAAKVLFETIWVEEDLRLAKRHYDDFYGNIIQPLNRLFDDKIRELEGKEVGQDRGEEGEDANDAA